MAHSIQLLAAQNWSRYRVDAREGNSDIHIRPGGFCTFDMRRSSNGLHYHHCFELCASLAGYGEFIHGGRSYPVSPGDVFLADPRVPHEIRFRKNSAFKESPSFQLIFWTFVINTEDLSSVSTAGSTGKGDADLLPGFLHRHAVIAPAQRQILTWLDFMEAYCCRTPHPEFGLKQAMRAMVLDCLRSLSGMKDAENSRMAEDTPLDQALGYIGRNLTRKLALQEIATFSCTSPRNLQYLFRHHLGKTPVDYINERRMSLAAGHLKMNFKASEAGELIGIGNPAQFSRLFKKYFGMSPRKYQLQHASGGMVYGAVHMLDQTACPSMDTPGCAGICAPAANRDR
ncbi:MAG TPA: hypothetical protein DD727_02680 [Clostridiales bacterium]|nr:hypothetical protein [Clostridiales bacterium]